MVRLSINIAGVFVLNVLFCVVPIENNKLDSRLQLLKKECQNAIDAIGKVVISTPEGAAKLTSIASTFVVSLNIASNKLNSVVPNMSPCEDRTVLAETTQVLNNLVNDMQYVLFGDADELQEKLVEALEEIQNFVKKFGSELGESSNKFVKNQLTKVFNNVLYATFKLKYQATLFETPNQCLEKEMRKTKQSLVEALACVSSTEEATGVELRQLLEHLANLVVRAIYDLQNWINVNPCAAENSKLIQDIVDDANLLYEKGNNAIKAKCVKDMKAAILDINAIAIELAIKAASVKYADNSGGTEFIRGSIFDVVAGAAAYAEIIKSVLL